MFHATLPNHGLGALRARDDIKLYSTPEAAVQGGGLFAPQQAAFYDGIAVNCLAKGVAVSVFCCPPANTYIDVATLAVVPRRTGGEVSFFPGFDFRRDGEQLHHQVARAVVQGAVYSCIFKLRCSKGLTVDNMYALWDAEVIDQSTFHLSRLSPDSTAVFQMSHSERIDGQKYVYLQAACLHTDRLGRRLIRVHTLQLPTTTSLSNVFRYAEIDSVTSLLLKQAARSALDGNTGFKDKLTKSCVDMLHAYRINCASTTTSGQLILPEALKLLPLFIGSIRKMPAFRSGSDIRADDRMAGLVRMLWLPIALAAPFVYPRIYTLAPLQDRAGLPTAVGEYVHLPPTVPCSIEKLAADKIYLIDNGFVLCMYVREEVPDELLRSAFGVSSASEVPAIVVARSGQAPENGADDDWSRILGIIQQVRRERSRLPWQPLFVATPGTPEEARTLAMLAEDRVAGEMPYVDFLCHSHKLVQNKLD
jgi:protein transport protein SEC24